MTPREGLVIIVPRGFNRSRIPAIIAEKREWIERTRIWAEEQRCMLASRKPLVVPGSIDLRSVGESWTVVARQTDSSRASAREHAERTLVLSGPIDDIPACLAALSRWTGRQARKHLVPWLEQLGSQTGFQFDRAIIGNQRTCWGSCSPKGTISLNQKLLFLPERLVNYVLMHELCHTAQMNHSRRFWSHVGRHEPAWRERRRELGESWQLVPPWLESTR